MGKKFIVSILLATSCFLFKLDEGATEALGRIRLKELLRGEFHQTETIY